jgi:hypothetical protein
MLIAAFVILGTTVLLGSVLTAALLTSVMNSRRLVVLMDS